MAEELKASEQGDEIISLRGDSISINVSMLFTVEGIQQVSIHLEQLGLHKGQSISKKELEILITKKLLESYFGPVAAGGNSVLATGSGEWSVMTSNRHGLPKGSPLNFLNLYWDKGCEPKLNTINYYDTGSLKGSELSSNFSLEKIPHYHNGELNTVRVRLSRENKEVYDSIVESEIEALSEQVDKDLTAGLDRL